MKLSLNKAIVLLEEDLLGPSGNQVRPLKRILLLPRQTLSSASGSAATTSASSAPTSSPSASTSQTDSSSSDPNSSNPSSNFETSSSNQSSMTSPMSSSSTTIETPLTESQKAEAKQDALTFGIIAGVFALIFIASFGGWAIQGCRNHRRRKRFVANENLKLSDSNGKYLGEEEVYGQLRDEEGFTSFVKYQNKTKSGSKKKNGRKDSRNFEDNNDEDDADEDEDSKALLSTSKIYGSNDNRNQEEIERNRPISYDPYIQAAMYSPQLDPNRKRDGEENRDAEVESSNKRTGSEHQRAVERY